MADDSRLRILVVGPGAIGGITAAFLARAGRDVHILGRRGASVDRIRSHGLHVYGVGGDFRVSPPVLTSVADLDGKPDVVLLATKATALPEVVKDLRPALAEGSRVVSLQNGIVEDIIAGVVGEERTVGCVVGWGATMRGPGELEMTSKGEFIVGRLDGREDEMLQAVRGILSLVRPTIVSPNILGHLYAKLIINSCITTLGAVSGLYLGEMLSLRRARELFMEIVREAMAVAAALGTKVEPVARLDFAAFLAGRGTLGELKRQALIRLIGLKYRRLKSSSLQSLERGEKTEIDFLNGYIVKKGRESGVPTPLNARLVQIVKEIEAGSRPISPGNLSEL